MVNKVLVDGCFGCFSSHPPSYHPVWFAIFFMAWVDSLVQNHRTGVRSSCTVNFCIPSLILSIKNHRSDDPTWIVWRCHNSPPLHSATSRSIPELPGDIKEVDIIVVGPSGRCAGFHGSSFAAEGETTVLTLEIGWLWVMVMMAMVSKLSTIYWWWWILNGYCYEASPIWITYHYHMVDDSDRCWLAI